MASQATLSDLWTKMNVPLRAFIRGRVRDADAADDIAQDVMLKVQRNLTSMPPEERMPAWVFGIARNAIVDHYRARRGRPVPVGAEVEPAAEAPDERERVTAELAVCLRRMIEHLPEPYRTALQLADIEGLGQQALADRSGISLSAAKSRVQRARRQLREVIIDCCEVETDARGRVVDYEPTARTIRYCGDPGERPCDR